MFDSFFRPRQRVIEWKGRRIICRPPTLDTLLLAFERLGLAFQGLADQEETIRTIPEDQRLLAVCTLLAQWRESAEVLETMTGPLPELWEDADLRTQVWSAAASLVDLDFLLAEFDWRRARETEVPEPPSSEENPRAFDDHLLRIGHLFGCSPLEIWTWPVDAALYAMRNAMRALNPEMIVEGEEVISANDAHPAVLQSLGIHVLSDRPPEA